MPTSEQVMQEYADATAVRGRQTAECFGVAPAGGSVEARYAVAYDRADGSITALRAYFPVRQAQEQLRSAAGLAQV